MLENDADALPRNAVRGPVRHLNAVEIDRACGRPLDPHDELHHGGFARAVRPDQAENLAALHLEADAVDRDKATIALDQAVHREPRHACSPRRKISPSRPLGTNRITTSAIAETMKVESSPNGRSASPAAMRKIAPIAAPMIVRRPPRTAAMITCTPTAIETSVPTDAVPM